MITNLTTIGTTGLVLGSLGGLLMMLMHLAKKPTPKLMARGHGIFNTLCVALVLLGLFQAERPYPEAAWWGSIILVGAMLGGVLFFRILPPVAPRLFAVAHGIFATIGLVLLLPASGSIRTKRSMGFEQGSQVSLEDFSTRILR